MPTRANRYRLLNAVAPAIDAGELRTTVSTVLTPIDAANLIEAHRRIETGTAHGKIVLEGF